MTPLQCSTEFKTSENFDTQFGTQTGEANISEYNGEEIAIYYSKEGLCRRLVILELNLSKTALSSSMGSHKERDTLLNSLV